MGNILSIKWKIGTFAFLAVSAFLLVKVIALNGQLSRTIENLETCRSDLTTSRNNAATLEAAVLDQNQSISNIATESQRRLDAASKALRDAQKQTRTLEARVAVIQSRPIAGSTLEQRVLDVDAMVLESVK